MSCSHAAARRTVPERAVRERCSRARPSLGVTGDMNMTTVQVAIRDKEYSQSICNLLRREGRYSVLAVDEPDLTREGVIVLDCEHMEGLPLAEEAPERFVLVTRKGQTLECRNPACGFSGRFAHHGATGGQRG